MPADQQVMLDLYQRLCRCREFETALIKYGTKDSKPVGHPYLGQEAVASGVCTALRPDDRVVGTHRAHGYAVAKGCDLERLALELYGSADGTCRGRAGEMYMAQTDVGYFGGTQIVGGNVAMAAGLALAAQLGQLDRVAVSFIGDGAVNQGVVDEALNMAAIWSLPLILVVENNGYAQTTSVHYATAGRIAERWAPYGITSLSVDGQRATEVYEAAQSARARAVGGQGPTVIEARTYRYEGHFYGDRHRRYRSQEEVDAWLARDPVELHHRAALEAGLTETALAQVRASASEESQAAFERARGGRAVAPPDLLEGVFTDPLLSQPGEDS
jgi:acetoin:2,6-dichlorophenolindophenol oxidoreductase subunit alpha